VSLLFQWDPRKARANERKHGISFEEASSAFGDPLSITIYDPDHSRNEKRYILVGETSNRRLVIISHTEDGDMIRIISARLATKRERKAYEEK